MYAAAAVKRAVRTTPVFAVQRILTPDEADAIVARGDADAVTVVRALIADEAWAAKAWTGSAETVGAAPVNQAATAPDAGPRSRACRTRRSAERKSWVRSRRRRRRDVWSSSAADPPASDRVGGFARARVPCRAVGAARREIALAAAAGGGGVAALADWCARVRGAASTPRRRRDGRRRSRSAPARSSWRPAASRRSAVAQFHPMPIPGGEQGVGRRPRGRDADPAALGRCVVILDAVGHIEAIGPASCSHPRRRGDDPTPPPADRPRRQTLAMALRAPFTPLAPEHRARPCGRPRGRSRLRARRTRETLGGVDTVVIRTHGLPDDALPRTPRSRPLPHGDALAVRTVDRAIHDGQHAGRQI